MASSANTVISSPPSPVPGPMAFANRTISLFPASRTSAFVSRVINTIVAFNTTNDTAAVTIGFNLDLAAILAILLLVFYGVLCLLVHKLARTSNLVELGRKERRRLEARLRNAESGNGRLTADLSRYTGLDASRKIIELESRLADLKRQYEREAGRSQSLHTELGAAAAALTLAVNSTKHYRIQYARLAFQTILYGSKSVADRKKLLAKIASLQGARDHLAQNLDQTRRRLVVEETYHETLRKAARDHTRRAKNLENLVETATQKAKDVKARHDELVIDYKTAKTQVGMLNVQVLEGIKKRRAMEQGLGWAKEELKETRLKSSNDLAEQAKLHRHEIVNLEHRMEAATRNASNHKLEEALEHIDMLMTEGRQLLSSNNSLSKALQATSDRLSDVQQELFKAQNQLNAANAEKTQSLAEVAKEEPVEVESTAAPFGDDVPETLLEDNDQRASMNHGLPVEHHGDASAPTAAPFGDNVPETLQEDNDQRTFMNHGLPVGHGGDTSMEPTAVTFGDDVPETLQEDNDQRTSMNHGWPVDHEGDIIIVPTAATFGDDVPETLQEDNDQRASMNHGLRVEANGDIAMSNAPVTYDNPDIDDFPVEEDALDMDSRLAMDNSPATANAPVINGLPDIEISLAQLSLNDQAIPVQHQQATYTQAVEMQASQHDQPTALQHQQAANVPGNEMQAPPGDQTTAVQPQPAAETQEVNVQQSFSDRPTDVQDQPAADTQEAETSHTEDTKTPFPSMEELMQRYNLTPEEASSWIGVMTDTEENLHAPDYNPFAEHGETSCINSANDLGDQFQTQPAIAEAAPIIQNEPLSSTPTHASEHDPIAGLPSVDEGQSLSSTPAGAIPDAPPIEAPAQDEPTSSTPVPVVPELPPTEAESQAPLTESSTIAPQNTQDFAPTEGLEDPFYVPNETSAFSLLPDQTASPHDHGHQASPPSSLPPGEIPSSLPTGSASTTPTLSTASPNPPTAPPPPRRPRPPTPREISPLRQAPRSKVSSGTLTRHPPARLTEMTIDSAEPYPESSERSTLRRENTTSVPTLSNSHQAGARQMNVPSVPPEDQSTVEQDPPTRNQMAPPAPVTPQAQTASQAPIAPQTRNVGRATTTTQDRTIVGRRMLVPRINRPLPALEAQTAPEGPEISGNTAMSLPTTPAQSTTPAQPLSSAGRLRELRTKAVKMRQHVVKAKEIFEREFLYWEYGEIRPARIGPGTNVEAAIALYEQEINALRTQREDIIGHLFNKADVIWDPEDPEFADGVKSP